jgi:methyltransferase
VLTIDVQRGGRQIVTMIIVGAIVYVAMSIEAARAARNEAVQRARGGTEPAGDVYAIMRLVYPSAFAAMLIEGAVRGGAPRPWVVSGALVFAAAKALKWWAISTLGDCWTFRVIVVPGTPLVMLGPYRWLRHPNYVGVAGELIGVALMTGAAVTGPLATILFGVLMLKRIAIEQRALLGVRRGPVSP